MKKQTIGEQIKEIAKLRKVLQELEEAQHGQVYICNK